jgi:GTP-binding protein
LSTAYEIWQERIRVLKDSEVDKVLKQAFESNPPHHVGLKQLQLRKAYQSGANPPAFTFEVNNPRLAYTSYKRYLEKQLRIQFPFPGTPLQIIVKKSGTQRKRKERLSVTNDS